MAVVGQSPILWGDIQPKVDGRINEVLRKLKREFPPEELARARSTLGRNTLAQAIRNKIMRECFLLDQVGTQAAEKRQEAAEMMDSRARQMFFENELKALMKNMGRKTSPNSTSNFAPKEVRCSPGSETLPT